MRKLAIIGAGNHRRSPQVIASLAHHFGEEELHIALYDPDQERSELFGSFAELCLVNQYSQHEVSVSATATEALEDADRLIVQLDVSSARKLIGGPSNADAKTVMHAALAKVLPRDYSGWALNLLPPQYTIPLDRFQLIDWPEEDSIDYDLIMPLQVLRWLRCEDDVYPFINAHEHSPLRRWLEDPASLPELRP